MDLFIWSGNPTTQVPSVDVDCLTAITYAKFCKTSPVQIQYKPCDNPKLSPSSQLPFLLAPASSPPSSSSSSSSSSSASASETTASPTSPADDPTVVTGLDAVLDHLRRVVGSTDPDAVALSTPERVADALALASLVKDSLHDAVLFEQWGHALNYASNTRPWFVDHLSFPLNYTVPRAIRAAVKARLETKYPLPDGYDFTSSSSAGADTHSFGGRTPNSTKGLFSFLSRSAFGPSEGSSSSLASTAEVSSSTVFIDEDTLYRKAREVMQTLSTQLSTGSRYLFGDQPCYVDALAFAHLLIAARSRLATSRLLDSLKAYPFLNRYCERIYSNLFSGDTSFFKEGAATPGAQSASEEKRLLQRRAWQFGLASVLVTLGYLFSSGLVNLPTLGGEGGEDDVYYYEDGGDDGDEE